MPRLLAGQSRQYLPTGGHAGRV